jgi:large subunit ribosomal protein L22
MTEKEIVATAKYVRQSPRRIRALVEQIKKLPMEDAIAELGVSVKKAATPLRKVLLSAVANAVQNQGLSQDSLRIKSIEVSPAPTLKRVHYRARGRADLRRKRSAHIRVVLESFKES